VTPSMTGALWERTTVTDEALSNAREQGLSEVVSRCVASRWAPEDVSRTVFEPPSLDHLHDPHAMHNMAPALDRLKKATHDGEPIRIITDYDVDGTTSSLILQAGLSLSAPGHTLDYHIPNRLTEGYGFSVQAAEQAAAAGIKLIVTADIGVRDHAAVQRARELGVDVLICDHHLPAGESVPSDAIVLCPPQIDCDYPNPYLAACGVSLKVAQALLEGRPNADAITKSLLKLAAVGTVADMVPLTSLENRAIVTLGLAELNRGPHSAGLSALLNIAGLSEHIAASDLGFRIGPRINAAGRMADASLIVRLLSCRDPEQAKVLAEQVEQHNRDRRELQDALIKRASEQLGTDAGSFVVVAGHENDGWHRGVVGIVAAKMKDQSHRSAAVISIHGEHAVGSIRAARGVHAVKALESAEDLLIRFGGHPAAAGFTVPTKNIDALRERLCAYVDANASESLVARRTYDADVDAGELVDRLHSELESLGPFGQGNPSPRLVVRNVQAQRVSLLGAAQKMVKFRIPRPGRDGLDAIWWDQAEHVPALNGGTVDILGNLSENIYRGRRSLQMRVSDVRLSQP
jgi:single-stranded-DNA-specific exonuclease